MCPGQVVVDEELPTIEHICDDGVTEFILFGVEVHRFFAGCRLESLVDSDKSCDEILRWDYDLILGDGLKA